MVKRFAYASLVISLLFILCVSVLTAYSSEAPAPGNEFTVKADRSVWWGGYELKREDYLGDTYLVSQKDAVLSGDEQKLTVFFLNFHNDPGNIIEYGSEEAIQVRIENAWYSLPDKLPRRTEHLVLPTLTEEAETRKYLLGTAAQAEHVVDLAGYGKLPPGEYRFIEKFISVGSLNEYYKFAYFWVAGSGEQPPIEAETVGTAREGDLEAFVLSATPARSCVTDEDSSFILIIRNRTGKIYDTGGRFELEAWKNEQWSRVPYDYTGGGLILAWSAGSYRINLRDPVDAGEYRLRYRAEVFGETSETVRSECAFEVIPHGDAPEPGWDTVRLMLSRFYEDSQSGSIAMDIADSGTISEKEATVRVTVSADGCYYYASPFDLDVLIDGVWYYICSLQSVFGDDYDEATDMSIEPGVVRYHDVNPALYIGVLPVGEYRLVREFLLYESSEAVAARDRNRPLAREFAIAEFKVVR